MRKIINLQMHSLWKPKNKKNKSMNITILIAMCISQVNANNEGIRAIMEKRNRRFGKVWTMPELRPPKNDGYYETVTSKLPDDRFQKKYRVNKSTFNFIYNTVRPDLKKVNTVMRDATCVEKRVIIALHVLKTNCDLSTIADLYKVGKSSVGKILVEFCDSLIRRLYTKEIRLPSTESEKQYISKRFFKKFDFQNTFGALDGTHVPIKKPTDNGEDYFNYKHYHSVNVLALVDDNYCFRYINTGRPGGLHDATILRDSKLFEFMNSSHTKFHIIADGAFPLKTWLMKPYTGTNLTLKQAYFNYKLSSARMVVENAFGRLKGRMRILAKRIDFSLETTKKIIKTCLIIHNLCEKNKCKYYPEWSEALNGITQYPNVPQRIINDRSDQNAQFKRDSIANSCYVV